MNMSQLRLGHAINAQHQRRAQLLALIAKFSQSHVRKQNNRKPITFTSAELSVINRCRTMRADAVRRRDDAPRLMEMAANWQANRWRGQAAVLMSDKGARLSRERSGR